ncbi:MAG: N-6 DNA methylase [Pirellulales bacterium]|nr:N-6 DNA methylase [Pirellulales bacterium]
MADILSYTHNLQTQYYAKTATAHRKRKGQIFTPLEIARFMAGLLSQIPRKFLFLDPGAGVGSLTAAVCERIRRSRAPHEVEVHLFETEPNLIALLHQNLSNCQKELVKHGHVLSYRVYSEDFILAAASRLDGQGRLFGGSLTSQYHAVVMNPPYFKVRKDSEHARVLDRVVHGQPNAYAFFMALAAMLLKPNGELIAITPRSFCSGLYFREFRRWFFDRMSLDHIHLFESRTDTFKDSGVLQESVITKSHRLGQPASSVTISDSFGKRIERQIDILTLASECVIDSSNEQHSVRIPTSQEDCDIMRLIESLPRRFKDTGLRISTGPVVTFRAKELLQREGSGCRVAPLLMPHNVRPFRTKWPIIRKNHPLYIVDCDLSRQRGLMIPTRNYVLLKRFTTKEEARRLTAACFLENMQTYPFIGLENHLNYIYHANRELSLDEVFGIASILNSTLFDRYFRVLSGNTQVNATDIRNLPFPSLDTVAKIGMQVQNLPEFTPDEVEPIVSSAIGNNGSLVHCLTTTA